MRGDFAGIIGRLKPSFVDFPGTVSAVLFYTGCNLRCPYCHNPSLVDGPFAPALSSDDIRAYLETRYGYVEGVVLSGGEPTLHPSVVGASRRCRELGYRLKLDTNGLRPAVIEAVSPDYLALDIKTLPADYCRLLGAGYSDVPRRLARSIEIVRSKRERAEVRITVAPGLVDSTVVRKLGPLLQGVHRVFLQPMQQGTELLNPSYREIAPLPAEEIESFRGILLDYVETCDVRGVGAERRRESSGAMLSPA